MFAETAADILLSTLTAVKICPITEKLIIVLCFSHTCNTAGTSVRQTLRMGVGLFFICWLINLNMHNELLKTTKPYCIYWRIHLNMHNEPVKLCAFYSKSILHLHCTRKKNKKKQVQQTHYWAGEMLSHFNVQMMQSIYFTVLEEVDE